MALLLGSCFPFVSSSGDSYQVSYAVEVTVPSQLIATSGNPNVRRRDIFDVTRRALILLCFELDGVDFRQTYRVDTKICRSDINTTCQILVWGRNGGPPGENWVHIVFWRRHGTHGCFRGLGLMGYYIGSQMLVYHHITVWLRLSHNAYCGKRYQHHRSNRRRVRIGRGKERGTI